MSLDGDSSQAMAEASAQRGLDRLHAGDSLGAVTAFQETIAHDPKHIEARHGLIRALSDLERLDEAVAEAHALTELTPDDPLAFAGLSIVLQRTGAIAEAEAAAGRARILEWKHQLADAPAE